MSGHATADDMAVITALTEVRLLIQKISNELITVGVVAPERMAALEGFLRSAADVVHDHGAHQLARAATSNSQSSQRDS